jgi:hypothetical protein
MATSNSNCKTCGCTDTYVVSAPCPPSCPEVFNSSCIVYTGTDILCNQTTVISRYDYLDTIITKLVNYICNVQAPVTVVAGSTYIDVVQNTVGNVTTYTVSVDIPTLQAYFDIIIAQTIGASILAGAGINVNVNPITNAVTVSHADTSSVADISSDNSGNTFIQDVFFTFDTFGHVTGASVVPASIIEASLTSAGGTESLVNDGVGPALATKGLTAGTGITLLSTTTEVTITNSAPDQTVVLTGGTGISTSGTYPNFTITNNDPGSAVTLIDAGTTTHESLVNDGTGPALATKGLKAGTGILLTSTGTDITITNSNPATIRKYTETNTLPGAGVLPITHSLGSDSVIVSVIDDVTNIALVQGVDYTWATTGINSIDIADAAFGGGDIRVTVIG